MTPPRPAAGLARRMRTTAVLAAIMAAAGSASAQQPPLALDRFEPSPAGDRFFSVASPFPGQHLTPHFSLLLDYAHDPLVLVRITDSGEEELGSVVEHQLHLHLGASFALFDYVSISLNMPFAIAQSGDSPAGRTLGLTSPDGAAVGDLRIGAKVRIWGEFDDMFQIGVGAYLWAPSGASESGSFTGEGTARGRPMLALGGRYESILWGLTAGPEFRSAQELVGTTQGTMMHWGLGFAGLLGPDDQVQLGPELSLSAVFDELEGRNTNAEALLGVKWRFVDFMEAGLALGPGISSGIGTPDFRGVLSIAYTPKPERDRDGDGIKDSADACPDVPGVPNDDPTKHGCPADADRDGDGILDNVDACPDVAGVASDDPDKNGCPADRDGDGVLDDDDACPDVPGVRTTDPKTNGCPDDRDGDRIRDQDDACPDVPGEASEFPERNGCPPENDRDGDGIVDDEDACPDVPGVASKDPKQHGCPLPSDRDGDGILDREDACPDEKGKPNPDPKKHGCPTVVVRTGDIVILQKVLFDTDRATIKPVSNGILDDVAEVLEAHAEIKRVEIQGHTDSQGGVAHNQGLSQRRADAVKAALVKRGIAATRLTAKGFGQTVPMAENATAEGRELNRRVEFKILERSKAPAPAR